MIVGGFMKTLLLTIKNHFMRLSHFQKIGFIILLLLYLVFPQMVLLPLSVLFIFIMLYKVPGVKKKAISLSVMLTIYAIAIALFLGFLLLTGADSINDEYVMTDLPLSNQAEKMYMNMIEDLSFYEVDPLYVGSQETFEMMVVMGYTRGYWFNREPIDYPRVLITPFSLSSTYNDLDIYIYNQFGSEIEYYSFKSSFASIQTKELNDDITSIIIQVKDSNRNVLYDSGEIDIYHERTENPNELSFGGQYDPTPTRNWILNAIAAHIAGLFIYVSLYYLWNKFILKQKKWPY